jgi:hypothetical protein
MGKFTGNFITQFENYLWKRFHIQTKIYDLHEMQNVYHERIYGYLCSYRDSVSKSWTLSISIA